MDNSGVHNNEWPLVCLLNHCVDVVYLFCSPVSGITRYNDSIGKKISCFTGWLFLAHTARALTVYSYSSSVSL